MGSIPSDTKKTEGATTLCSRGSKPLEPPDTALARGSLPLVGFCSHGNKPPDTALARGSLPAPELFRPGTKPPDTASVRGSPPFATVVANQTQRIGECFSFAALVNVDLPPVAVALDGGADRSFVNGTKNCSRSRSSSIAGQKRWWEGISARCHVEIHAKARGPNSLRAIRAGVIRLSDMLKP